MQMRSVLAAVFTFSSVELNAGPANDDALAKTSFGLDDVRLLIRRSTIRVQVDS